jgi:hypothetical protein
MANKKMSFFKEKVQLRNNIWLANRLEWLWKTYFSDVEIANTVYVRFGRPARTRLGSIKYGRKTTNPNTYITVTGHFRNPIVPEYVIDAVLAHELSHYTHGFFSPHPQIHKNPHQHGVIDKELTKRGLEDIMRLQKSWLKENWRDFLRKYD